MADEGNGAEEERLRFSRVSTICRPGSRRTALSPTWSDPEGSSHNDFVPGRRLPPFRRQSAFASAAPAPKQGAMSDSPEPSEEPGLGLDLPEAPQKPVSASPYR